MRAPRRVKAWLVTWEWIGDHAKRDEKIAAILNPRLSETKVKEIVELLYMQEGYSLSEKLTCALHKKRNPYPANIEYSHGRWPTINCGHNPFLRAEPVDDFAVQRDDHGFDIAASWKTIPSGELRRVTLRSHQRG